MDKFTWMPDDIKLIKRSIDTSTIKVTDLRKWEAKSLKSLRRFHKADVAFESNAIPFDEQVAIHAALKAATDSDAVKAAFKQDSTDALLDDVDQDARAWVEEVTGGSA